MVEWTAFVIVFMDGENKKMYQKTWTSYRYDFYWQTKLIQSISRHEIVPGHFLGDRLWIEGEGDVYVKEIELGDQEGDELVINLTLLF